MGASKRQMEEARESKKHVKAKPTSLFHSFKPTKEQVDEIGQFWRDPAEALGVLRSLFLRNVQLKISWRENLGSYMCTLMEAVEYPAPAKGLTVWHSDPVKAFMALLYAAEEVYPEFPEMDWPPGGQTEFW